jgi:hypothetical protein
MKATQKFTNFKGGTNYRYLNAVSPAYKLEQGLVEEPAKFTYKF